MLPRLVSHPSPGPRKEHGSGIICFYAQSRQRSASHQPGSPETATSPGVPCMTSKSPCTLNSELPETPAVHFRGTPPRNPAAQVCLGLPLFWGAEQGRAPAAGNAPKGRPDGRGPLRNRWAAGCARRRGHKRRCHAHRGAGSPARDWTTESRAHRAAGASRQTGPRAATVHAGSCSRPILRDLFLPARPPTQPRPTAPGLCSCGWRPMYELTSENNSRVMTPASPSLCCNGAGLRFS